MNPLNPTFRMWKNRLTRIRTAWVDPNHKNIKPAISHGMTWFCAALCILIVAVCQCYLAVTGARWMTSSTVWDTLGIFLMICTAAWLIGRPSAKFEKELNDHRACFWILLFFGSFLGGFPLLVCVDMIHKNRPVTQAIFDAAKAADPSCNRYEAFRADRLAKGVVFDIRDLGRAKDECIEHNEKTAALEQQKAIK